MSSRKSDGPVAAKVRPPAPAPRHSTCTCQQCPLHPPKPATAKPNPAITIYVSSTFDPNGICYKVKGETLFKRFSDDYHERKNMIKGSIVFFYGAKEIPWDFVGDFTSVLSISPDKASQLGKTGNEVADYVLEAYKIV